MKEYNYERNFEFIYNWSYSNTFCGYGCNRNSFKYSFIHIADVTGWNCVLRFILASFDLIISIFIIFVLGWVVQESDKND